MVKPWEQPTVKDLQIVEEQLGRRPGGIIGVAVRCRYGRPQVVVSAPLRLNGQSVLELPAQANPGTVSLFPTLYWLTCPALRESIGRLESVGWIIRIKEQLQHDPVAVAELKEAHARTARVRRSLIPDSTLSRLESDYPGQYKVLTASGVAGMRDEEGSDELGVKCLHAHFADYLAQGNNPVGRRVWALLTKAGVDPRGWGECFSGCNESCPGMRNEQAPQAVIDVGSNSVRLLVADISADGIHSHKTDLMTTRLGAGVADEGLLAPEAIDQTVQALKDLRTRARAYGVENPFAIGTSALREASNSDELLVRAWEEAEVSVRVISGEEEGRLSFRGALAGGDVAGGSVLLCDVGGGSTELIVGDGAGNVTGVLSLPLGAVRLHTLVQANESLEDCLACMRQKIEKGFRALVADGLVSQKPGTMLAVGGTATTVAALDLRMTTYDPGRVNGYRLTHQRLGHWLERLLAMSPEERSSLQGMPPGRADIMPYGLAILWTVLDVAQDWVGSEIQVSDNDLLHGVLVSNA